MSAIRLLVLGAVRGHGRAHGHQVRKVAAALPPAADAATVVSAALFDEAPGPLRTGVSLGSSVGCTTGLDAIGHAAELMREGSTDVMPAGATDAPISPITVACFDAIKATSPRNDDPTTASRPFDRTRNGFLIRASSPTAVRQQPLGRAGRLHRPSRRSPHLRHTV